jgi:hypothetical protein
MRRRPAPRGSADRRPETVFRAQSSDDGGLCLDATARWQTYPGSGRSSASGLLRDAKQRFPDDVPLDLRADDVDVAALERTAV